MTEQDMFTKKIKLVEAQNQTPNWPKARLVEAKSQEGQKLRRKLLEGATIVFFTAGYAGKRFIYERAMQLGVKTVAFFNSSDCFFRQK